MCYMAIHTRKTAGTAENPAANKFSLFDIQMVVLLLLENIYTSIAYRSGTTQNLNDLDFVLSRSLKINFDSAIGLPIYGFLLIFTVTQGITRLLCQL